MQAFRVDGSEVRVWLDQRHMEGVLPAWFEADHWGGSAQHIAEAGRGGNFRVSGPFGRAVLRRYRRGGLAAKLSADRFLWKGEGRVRSFAEFKLLQGMVALKLPVPEPLAAAVWKDGWFYRAALLMREIDAKSDFQAAVHADPYHAPWEALGQCIARFHLHRCHHVDLNASNVLLGRDGRIYIIDWDKARIESNVGGWTEDVLARLERHLIKYRGQVSEASIHEGMQRLRNAHDQVIRE